MLNWSELVRNEVRKKDGKISDSQTFFALPSSSTLRGVNYPREVKFLVEEFSVF